MGSALLLVCLVQLVARGTLPPSLTARQSRMRLASGAATISCAGGLTQATNERNTLIVTQREDGEGKRETERT